jgi:O-acetyl-ADP-ribose deacetylase (regulator of RNase III)
MPPETLSTRKVGACTIEAVRGDITEEEVDAVVNAANSHLAHGGGLAGAIVRRGGSIIQEESDRLAPVAVGSAVVTTAGDLPSRWVIHAVGPRWGEGDEERKLRSAVRSSLDRALEQGATSLSIPAISTGIFGYPKEKGTRDLIDEVTRWLADHPQCKMARIRLTAFDQPTAALFAQALGQVKP